MGYRFTNSLPLLVPRSIHFSMHSISNRVCVVLQQGRSAVSQAVFQYYPAVPQWMLDLTILYLDKCAPVSANGDDPSICFGKWVFGTTFPLFHTHQETTKGQPLHLMMMAIPSIFSYKYWLGLGWKINSSDTSSSQELYFPLLNWGKLYSGSCLRSPEAWYSDYWAVALVLHEKEGIFGTTAEFKSNFNLPRFPSPPRSLFIAIRSEDLTRVFNLLPSSGQSCTNQYRLTRSLQILTPVFAVFCGVISIRPTVVWKSSAKNNTFPWKST